MELEALRAQYEKLLCGSDTDRLEGQKLGCKYDLRYLCRDILGFNLWSKFHDEMHDFILQSQKKRKLILVPRGHFKTSIVTIGHSIQRILQNPDIRILVASYTWGISRDILSQLQAYFTGASELNKIFGEFRPKGKSATGWNRDSITVQQRRKPLKESTVTTAGVDKNLVGQHYDLIILDDVVAEDNIQTREKREKVRTFYRNCLSLLEPDGEVIVVGTTWHEDDIYNDIRDPKGIWNDSYDIYLRKAIEDGVYVFPERFNPEVIERLKKELGIFKFSSQYMLDPYPDEELVFKKEWLRYYDELPKNDYFVSVTLDPSLGKENSDYAAITATAIDRDTRVFILEARRFKCHVDLIPSQIIRTINSLKSHGIRVNVVGIESFQFQQTLLEPIRKALAANNIDVYVDLLPHLTSSSKVDRIQTLIPKYANGYIYHKKFDHQDLEEEMSRWKPNAKQNRDDILDALAWQCIKYWERKPNSKPQEKIRPYSFEWWLNMNTQKKNDIFSDMRYGKSNPGILN